MPTRVDIGNGYIAEFPDGMSKDDIRGALQKNPLTAGGAAKSTAYDTKLSAADEQAFQGWKQKYAPKDSGADYDLRGAFKAGLRPDPQTGHWPDTYKKPNHPTFSNESQYAVGADAAKAGRWTGPNHDVYMPPTSAPSTAGSEQLRTSNPMATQEHAPAPTLAQEAQGYAEGIGQGAFNVGGIVGSRVNPDYEAQHAARAEQTPISSALGYLTGAIAGGGPLVKGIGAVGRVAAGALGRTAEAALPETAGLLRRGANVIGIGGAGGAVTAAGEGQDVPTGAAVGGVVAPVAVGLGKVTTSLGRAVKGVMSGSQRSTNAVRALAQNYKMTTDEMTTALDNFQVQQGRPAGLSDIADLQSKGMLKQYAAKNPAFGAEVAKAAEQRATVEPKAITGNPNQPSDVPSFEKYRKDRMTAAMQPFENNPVQLSKPVLDALVEPDVYETLPRTQKRLILNAKDGTKPLTVRELDNLRQTFASKAGEGDSARYGEYAKSIEALTTNAEPQYGAAMNQWRRDSNFIDSFAHGRAGGAQTKGGNDMLQAALATNEGKVGYKLGAAERTAASNVEDVAPGFIKPADRLSSAEAAHLAIAGAKIGSPWSVYHLIRAIPGIKAADNTLRLAAKYFLDPNMARQGVALLKQSKASDAEIAKVVAAVSGGLGASTANAIQQ